MHRSIKKYKSVNSMSKYGIAILVCMVAITACETTKKPTRRNVVITNPKRYGPASVDTFYGKQPPVAVKPAKSRMGVHASRPSSSLRRPSSVLVLRLSWSRVGTLPGSTTFRAPSTRTLCAPFLPRAAPGATPVPVPIGWEGARRPGPATGPVDYPHPLERGRVPR